MGRARRVPPLAAAGLTALLALTGCSGTTTVAPSTNPVPIKSPMTRATNVAAVPQDREAFHQLSAVAPKALKLEGGTVESTACWTPSRHLFNDRNIAPAGTWKVLCRVYYDLKGTPRYQDATCIGDFETKPMLDHCYVWELYSDEARFEDGDKLASPSPTPAP